MTPPQTPKQNTWEGGVVPFKYQKVSSGQKGFLFPLRLKATPKVAQHSYSLLLVMLQRTESLSTCYALFLIWVLSTPVLPYFSLAFIQQDSGLICKKHTKFRTCVFKRKMGEIGFETLACSGIVAAQLPDDFKRTNYWNSMNFKAILYLHELKLS